MPLTVIRPPLTKRIVSHNEILLLSPVLGDLVPSYSVGFSLTVNVVSAVPLSVTISIVCSPAESSPTWSSFKEIIVSPSVILCPSPSMISGGNFLITVSASVISFILYGLYYNM